MGKMHMKLILFLVGCGFLFSHQALATEKMDLKSCYESALSHSESVAISQEAINQAKTLYGQALGEVLPKVEVRVSEVLQDDSAQSSSSGVSSSFTRFSRPEVALQVTQNLFQGLKEIVALRLSGVNESQKRFELEDAERLLFQDVATAFNAVAKVEADLSSTDKIIRTLKQRVRELQERVKLGKSRLGEQAAQEAELSLLEASLEEKKGQRKVAYEMLGFLTGLDPQPPIKMTSSIPEIRPLQEYLEKVKDRSDLKAYEKAIEIAKGEIKVQRSKLLPHAEVTANYYPYRVGFQKDIHWDATFNATVPLFNWGNYGLVREAKSKAKQTELKSEENKRLALSEVKRTYESYQASRTKLLKYTQAVQKSEVSYSHQVEDFSLGLVNNLDVLQSQKTWLEALKLRDEAKVEFWANAVALQIVAGIKP